MATTEMTSPKAFLGRLLWMLVGPVALLALTFFIIDKGSGWLTLADFLFFAVLGLMILGRWLEFRHGTPLTSTGEPATRAHLHRYIVLVIVLGLAAWVAANLVGNHLLAS